jgi:hypothetical protein
MATSSVAPPPPHTLAAHIAQWRNAVLDYELLVGDRRVELDRAVIAFQDAVRERQRAAVHLQHLLDLADDD